MLAASSTIKIATPRSSAITPTLLIQARSRTPTELISGRERDQDAAQKDGVGGGACAIGGITDQLEHWRDLREASLEGRVPRPPD